MEGTKIEFFSWPHKNHWGDSVRGDNFPAYPNLNLTKIIWTQPKQFWLSKINLDGPKPFWTYKRIRQKLIEITGWYDYCDVLSVCVLIINRLWKIWEENIQGRRPFEEIGYVKCLYFWLLNNHKNSWMCRESNIKNN